MEDQPFNIKSNYYEFTVPSTPQFPNGITFGWAVHTYGESQTGAKESEVVPQVADK